MECTRWFSTVNELGRGGGWTIFSGLGIGGPIRFSRSKNGESDLLKVAIECGKEQVESGQVEWLCDGMRRNGEGSIRICSCMEWSSRNCRPCWASLLARTRCTARVQQGVHFVAVDLRLCGSLRPTWAASCPHACMHRAHSTRTAAHHKIYTLYITLYMYLTRTRSSNLSLLLIIVYTIFTIHIVRYSI